MASKSPWSVKGISQEDRDTAKAEARRAGIPIGVWLSDRIRRAAELDAQEASEQADGGSSGHAGDRGAGGDHAGNDPASGDPRFAFGPGQWSTATDAVDSGLVSVVPPDTPPNMTPAPMPYPQQMPPMPPHMPHPYAMPPQPQQYYAPMPAQMPAQMPAHMMQPAPIQEQVPAVPPVPAVELEQVTALESRLDDLSGELRAIEGQVSGRLDPIGSRLDSMVEEIEVLRAEIDQPRNSTGFSTAPIERAVMRLSERLQRVEDLVLPEESEGRGFFARLFGRR